MRELDAKNIPLVVRNRLDARRYSRMGLISVRFGMPLDGPGQYNYEITQDDREMISQVIEDNNSGDALRAKLAFDAWADSVTTFVPTIYPFLASGEAGAFLFNFLGNYVLQRFNPVSGGLTIDSGSWSVALTSASVGNPYLVGGDYHQDVQINVAATLYDWFCSFHTAGTPDFSLFTMDGVFWNAVPVGSATIASDVGESATITSFEVEGDHCDKAPMSFTESDYMFTPNPAEVLANETSGSRTVTFQTGIDGDCYSVVLGAESQSVEGEALCTGETFDFTGPDAASGLGGPDELGELGDTGDTPVIPLTKDQIDDIIDALKNSDWCKAYCPNCSPPPGDPGSGVDLPGEPGSAGGPGSEPGSGVPPAGDPPLDPIDPTSPTTPPLGGTPLDDFNFNNGIGKTPMARMRSPLFDNPFDDNLMPGKPFGLDFDGLPRQGKIGRFDPGGLDGGGFGGLPNLPGFPSGGLGGLPGGGLGGLPGTGLPPIDIPDPGEIIGPLPPFPDGTFTEDTCYPAGKPLVDIAVELAVEVGFEETKILLEETCTSGAWPGGCFAAGSSKMQALWRVLDLMGAGIFPDYSGGAIIGCITPLNVHHGPYHEHKNLFVFSPIFDDLDIPRFVVYKKPPAVGSPGSGYEIRVEVVTIYTLPEDKEEVIYAPAGMTEAQAVIAAAARAEAYERQTKLVEFAVPLKLAIDLRHQANVRQPSRGIDINYMVWEYTHDAPLDEGWVTMVRGVELSRSVYAPRFENYATAWAS